jgi:putative CocE/NonD family hydrolase
MGIGGDEGMRPAVGSSPHLLPSPHPPSCTRGENRRNTGLSAFFALALSAPFSVVVEKNVEAPMRDGVVLRADVYRPDAPGRFPALLKRTPYSKGAATDIPFFRRLASEGFVVAVQDTRGRYMSDGIARPHDEAEDGADTVEWLAALPYVDGKVGMFGGSYAATTQLTAASLHPRGLAALFPSSSYASRYDMVYQGGAFYLLDGLRWNLGQAVDVATRASTGKRRDAPIGLSDEEEDLARGRWVFHLPLKSADIHELRRDMPGYFEMLDHPSYDEYWKKFDISRRHSNFDVPALHLTGWYDSLLVGTLRNFEGLRARASTERARTGQRLIVGPWTHARPSASSTRIGDVDFGPEAGLDSQALLERWFREWLQGEDTGILREAPVRLFVMGADRWRDEQEWPLSRAADTPFYLRENGALSRELPEDEAPDRYLYDPWNPAPTPTWQGYSRAPVDTTFLESRSDVLVYTSPPLEEPLEVTGYVGLTLTIASSAPDTDFTGRLLDVFPDGSARTLTEGIIRARYRKGFERPELLVPGEPTEVAIELGATSNLFRRGHRIRLEVSSSNFPRWDRNPNTAAPFGEESEPKPAEQTVFHDRARLSKLVLPLVPPEPPSLPTGFTAGAYRSVQAKEDALAARISRARISEFHRRLTARPHRAGTEGAHAVADYLAATLKESGLEVEVKEYYPYLSQPKRASVEMIEPASEPLALDEPSDPRDPDSGNPDLGPGFIAYSGSGTVEGGVVYAGYGLPSDYEGVDVRGKIALVRYGKSHRAVKVATAQERGATGILIYSDPEDDGAGKGAVWPEGPYRAPDQLQRGNAKLSWFWHGDPLTPGVAATEGAERLDPRSAPTLPRIPAIPLSAREAAKILEALPRGVRVRVDVEMEGGIEPVRDVIARVPGRTEPDRYVMLGTHHDAWTFGGVDPGSATAVLMETAYDLASLAREGLGPERSVVFCFWDAEEYGLIGSTEFAEDRLKDLREKAVAYINTDMYNGDRLSAGGTPSLRDFVREVASDVPGIEPPEDLSALGSGADFVPFQDFVGLPTLSLELLFEGGWGFGTYHSNYDDRYWMMRHGDEDFRRGALLARILGTAALRLADAPVLPYRFSYYGKKLESFAATAEGWGGGHRFENLKRLASDVRRKAEELEVRIDADLEAGRVPPGTGALNDALMRLEQTLVDESSPAEERWYRHVVHGWNIYSLYSGQAFPGLEAAITRGGEEDVARETARIERALERLSRSLDAIAVAR